MTKAEERTIRNIIARLRSANLGAASPMGDVPVRGAENPTPTSRLYVDTWLITPLECLLPERRDTALAVSMSGR